MSQKYFTTLTHIGAALHANAQLQQTTVPWTHLVLGDGNGVEPVPNPAQTGVIHEVDRLAISSIAPDPDNPNWIVVEAVIPADRGGYVVRETALMGGADGNSCIAVGNYPSATKPLLSEGAGSELIIRVVVEVAHTATVTLKIDPAVVIASRDWVQKQEATEEQAKQGSILGRWTSPLRVLQLLRASAAQATEVLRGTLRIASSADMLDAECNDAAVTPERLLEFSAATGMVVFDTPGVYTWQVPDVLKSGARKAHVVGVGGGGSGCRNTVSTGGIAYGGGGGGAFEIDVDLSGVTSVTCTVGNGGVFSGGSATASGAQGGTTSFGSYASATGGMGGITTPGSGVPGGTGVSSIEGAVTHTGSSGQMSYLSTEEARHGGQGGGTIFGPGGMSNSGGWCYGAGGGATFGTVQPVGSGAGGVIIIKW